MGSPTPKLEKCILSRDMFLVVMWIEQQSLTRPASRLWRSGQRLLSKHSRSEPRLWNNLLLLVSWLTAWISHHVGVTHPSRKASTSTTMHTRLQNCLLGQGWEQGISNWLRKFHTGLWLPEESNTWRHLATLPRFKIHQHIATTGLVSLFANGFSFAQLCLHRCPLETKRRALYGMPKIPRSSSCRVWQCECCGWRCTEKLRSRWLHHMPHMSENLHQLSKWKTFEGEFGHMHE